MEIEQKLSAAELLPAVRRLFELAAEKTLRLCRRWNAADGAPVVTKSGLYTARNWTQWTQGFQYGNALLAFEQNGDATLLKIGRDHTVEDMAGHLTHTGVHDHGFNTLSTYGQLRRLALESKIDACAWELRFYELALKASGAVQAARWTQLGDNSGYIYSFNGSHSLFIDTMRTLRICAVAHLLGHALLGEQDRRISLLNRLLQHAQTSARFNIYYGDGRDIYDRPELRGRTAHEAIFNPTSGSFRCPSSQQGYSPFSTWTRGLAWAMLGFAEELEFIQSLADEELSTESGITRAVALEFLDRAATATCDFYIDQASARDGICYWDTGAPALERLGDWRHQVADPLNAYEPVDASASAIAAQGLIRLGHAKGESGSRYMDAGLSVARTLLGARYLSTQLQHEGILLHSIYHRPSGWDYAPQANAAPAGESSMWGDYHMLELGLLITRLAENRYYTFF